ncbi:MAG: metal-dependent hydrolase, partial [Candidatus Zixiibacteriota bacterium]
ALGVAKFNPKLIDTYGRPTEVKGFSGPSFGFLKRKDGAVEVVFIPFHRRSGHSMTMGVVLALLGWILTGVWQVGAAIFMGWTMHIVLDSFGHLGNNLFWPVTKQRTSGLYLVSASNPYWNAFTIYSCILIMLWNMNLYNASVSASYTIPAITSLGLGAYLLLGIFAPWSIIGVVYYYHMQKTKGFKPFELFAPSTGGVGLVATEGTTVQEPEHYYEVSEKPRPSIIWRALGIGILIAIFVVLFAYGPTW